MINGRSTLGAPFRGAEAVAIVGLPVDTSDDDLASIRTLIERELHEFSVELGAPVFFADSAPADCPTFLIGPATSSPEFERLQLEPSPEAVVYIDHERRLLVADGPDVGAIVECLSLLRTLAITGADQVTSNDCASVADGIERVRTEVEMTYPSFELRGLDWHQICERHIPEILKANEPFPAFQRWLAELQDMHTWVQPSPPLGLLPYAVQVEPDGATLVRVPEWTSAWAAGVREGDRILNLECQDALDRTGASPHMHPYLAGRRAISGTPGVERSFEVLNSNGEHLTFSDTPSFTPWQSPVEWTRLESGTGYLKLSGFPPGMNDAVDAAFAELNGCNKLIVDLRGNSGGLLIEALDFRDRFLKEHSVMGSIQFSSPDGGLSETAPIIGEPAPASRLWNGQVRFLTDPLTASASEDALLGLQGLPHVTTIGLPSGGGSGRARSLRLLPGMRFAVSTALTYDRTGRCVEGNGIAPDIEANPLEPGFSAKIFQITEGSW